MKHIGQNIRNLRRMRNWSQRQVVQILGISIAAFSNIERGITDINISRLNAIAKILDVSVSEILTKPDQKHFKMCKDELNRSMIRLEQYEMELLQLKTTLKSLSEELSILTNRTK